MDKIKQQKGIVFFTTLILLGLATLICAAIVFMVLRDAYTFKRIEHVSQAYYLAEAGVEKAINELYSNFSWPGETRTIGKGSYAVSIDTCPGISTRKLITATGTIPGNGIIPATSRVIKVQVQSNIPPVFDYAVWSAGDLKLWRGANITGDIHSNSTTTPWTSYLLGAPYNAGGAVAFISPFGLSPLPVLNGNVTAVGPGGGQSGINNVNGIINGSSTSPASAVAPLFDDNDAMIAFFNWYATAAANDNPSDVYTPSGGTQTFTDAAALGNPPNYVTYVNGNVVFRGTCTITGCVVATGDITFDWVAGTTSSTTQTQSASLPPTPNPAGYAAFLAQGSISADWRHNVNISGMVYTGGNFRGSEIWLGGNCIHNGSLYSNGTTFMRRYTLNYVRPHPKGLSTPDPITVLSWTEQ